MLIVTIVLLVMLLIASIVINFALYKAASRQLNRAAIYETWISELKDDVMRAYIEIKTLDNRQIFEKDDEVGVVFQEILTVVEKLNERTQEAEEETSE